MLHCIGHSQQTSTAATLLTLLHFSVMTACVLSGCCLYRSLHVIVWVVFKGGIIERG